MCYTRQALYLEEVNPAGARDGDRGAWPTLQARPSIGSERGRLLVVNRDELQPSLADRIDRVVDVPAPSPAVSRPAPFLRPETHIRTRGENETGYCALRVGEEASQPASECERARLCACVRLFQ